MNKVKVYVTTYCPYCDMAKRFLKEREIPFETIDLTHDAEQRNALIATTGMRTVPQIFVDDDAIGGFTDMRDLDARGEFVPKLDAAGIPHVGNPG